MEFFLLFLYKIKKLNLNLMLLQSLKLHHAYHTCKMGHVKFNYAGDTHLWLLKGQFTHICHSLSKPSPFKSTKLC